MRHKYIYVHVAARARKNDADDDDDGKEYNNMYTRELVRVPHWDKAEKSIECTYQHHMQTYRLAAYQHIEKLQLYSINGWNGSSTSSQRNTEKHQTASHTIPPVRHTQTSIFFLVAVVPFEVNAARTKSVKEKRKENGGTAVGWYQWRLNGLVIRILYANYTLHGYT